MNQVSSSKVKVRAELSEKSLSISYILSNLVEFGSYHTYRVPLGKGCAVTLNQVYKSMVKVIHVAELSEKSLSG